MFCPACVVRSVHPQRDAREPRRGGDSERPHRLRLRGLDPVGRRPPVRPRGVQLPISSDVHDDEEQIAFNDDVALTTEGGAVAVQAAQQRAADEALFLEYAQLANEAATTGDRATIDAVAYIQNSLMRDEPREMVEWWGEEGVRAGIRDPVR